nr:uncharacterized protein LOC128698668 [Cherax quadricarinatus]
MSMGSPSLRKELERFVDKLEATSTIGHASIIDHTSKEMIDECFDLSSFFHTFNPTTPAKGAVSAADAKLRSVNISQGEAVDSVGHSPSQRYYRESSATLADVGQTKDKLPIFVLPWWASDFQHKPSAQPLTAHQFHHQPSVLPLPIQQSLPAPLSQHQPSALPRTGPLSQHEQLFELLSQPSALSKAKRLVSNIKKNEAKENIDPHITNFSPLSNEKNRTGNECGNQGGDIQLNKNASMKLYPIIVTIPSMNGCKDILVIDGEAQKTTPRTSNPAKICPKCGLRVASKGHLKRHWTAHGANQRHKCFSCDCSFTRKKKLTIHLHKAHDITPALNECEIVRLSNDLHEAHDITPDSKRMRKVRLSNDLQEVYDITPASKRMRKVRLPNDLHETHDITPASKRMRKVRSLNDLHEAHDFTPPSKRMKKLYSKEEIDDTLHKAHDITPALNECEIVRLSNDLHEAHDITPDSKRMRKVRLSNDLQEVYDITPASKRMRKVRLPNDLHETHDITPASKRMRKVRSLNDLHEAHDITPASKRMQKVRSLNDLHEAHNITPASKRIRKVRLLNDLHKVHNITPASKRKI